MTGGRRDREADDHPEGAVTGPLPGAGGPPDRSVDRLVRDYVDRLEAAAAALPTDQRRELTSSVAEHLTAAREAGELPDEAAARTLLDRFGSPAEIVAAAQGQATDRPGSPGGGPVRGTGLEIAAAVMLTAGSFVPVAGWLIGLVLLWASQVWTVREKLLGTLVSSPVARVSSWWRGSYRPGRRSVPARAPSSTWTAPAAAPCCTRGAPRAGRPPSTRSSSPCCSRSSSSPRSWWRWCSWSGPADGSRSGNRSGRSAA